MKTWEEYEKLADLTTQYGASYKDGKWSVNLWHPFAKKVVMVVFDKNDQNKIVKEVEGKFVSPNWTWEFEEDMDAMFYQYKITQEDGTTNLALDPFAKSMAAFNWEGKNTNVGKAAFVKVDKIKNFYKLNKINEPQPIIYETHVRDLTSLREDVTQKGSFKAIEEIKLADHLNEVGINTIQLMPIHNCYALDETNQNTIGKGEGNGWSTNYNWGYDPHNYFTVNGWYSSNPHNPYTRIEEFRDLVKYFHKNGIKVVNDVVYNHIYKNQILHNVIPGYYFRPDHVNKPVGEPALASERAMVRRVIVESLKWFLEVFDVDGFRFDLLTFTDKETIEIAIKELRAIKPNIIMHGEAWPWTDLKEGQAFDKMYVDNEIDLAYFNDTTRNAIKGEDDGDGFALGIVGGNGKEFPKYLSSVIGNIMNFNQKVDGMSEARYDRFTENPNISLNYSACHDGHTLWDKVNLTVKGDKLTKFEHYRQALMMQQLLQGRTLYLGGTEVLYTKPNDESGQDGDRSHKTDLSIDLFGLGNVYNENSYRTTDYTNGIRWNNQTPEVKENITDFFAALNKFRASTKFFNLSTSKEINDYYTFNHVDKENLIIDFTISIKDKTIRVIHNFGQSNYNYKSSGEIFMDSSLQNKNVLGESRSHSSIIINE